MNYSLFEIGQNQILLAFSKKPICEFMQKDYRSLVGLQGQKAVYRHLSFQGLTLRKVAMHYSYGIFRNVKIHQPKQRTKIKKTLKIHKIFDILA